MAVSARGRLTRPAERFAIVASFGGAERNLVLAVQPPAIRETKWNLNGFHTDRVLSFPAMLFGSRFYRGVFESFWGFFLKDPYTGPGTRLYQTVLPNGTPNGWVCMGNERTRDALVLRTAGLGSWQEKVALLLEHFWWDSNFSDHVIDRLTANGPRLHPRLSSLARWEAASRTEPNFIHTVAWDPAGTVEDFVRHLMGGSR